MFGFKNYDFQIIKYTVNISIIIDDWKSHNIVNLETIMKILTQRASG